MASYCKQVAVVTETIHGLGQETEWYHNTSGECYGNKLLFVLQLV